MNRTSKKLLRSLVLIAYLAVTSVPGATVHEGDYWELGLIETDPDQGKKLEAAGTNWLSKGQFREMRRLIEDARFEALRKKAKEILDKNIQYRGAREVLDAIGYNPFASVEKNREAIENTIAKGEIDGKIATALIWVAHQQGAPYRDLLDKASTAFKNSDYHPIELPLKPFARCPLDQVALE